MKHAYLVIAHNEFGVLDRLIHALDDDRNDIYVHFDSKIDEIPVLNVHYANLIMVDKRFDVRWGHSSLVEVEMYLFEIAFSKGNYSYFHLVSGVHMPLTSQDYLHQLFTVSNGKDYVKLMDTSEGEVNLKVRRYHFFVKNFVHNREGIKRINQFIWKLLIKLQKICKIYRNTTTEFYKASQWVSLTQDSVNWLICHKKNIVRKYQYTFCADEFFIVSELKKSRRQANLYHFEKLLAYEFVGINPKVYKLKDLEYLMGSGCLFARKFSADDIEVVDKILSKIKTSR